MLTVVFTSTAAVLLTKEKDIIQHLYLPQNDIVTINYTDLTVYYEDSDPDDIIRFKSLASIIGYVEDLSLYNTSVNGLSPEIQIQTDDNNIYAIIQNDSISLVYHGPDYSTTDSQYVFGTVATVPIRCDIVPHHFQKEYLVPYNHLLKQ